MATMTDLPRGYTVNPLTNPPDPGITGPATPPPPAAKRAQADEFAHHAAAFNLVHRWTAALRAAEQELHLQHRDGHTDWYHAPLPRRWHRCQVWTTGVVNGRRVDRCACGAIRTDGRHWDDRNSRRKEKR
jgi:hypothetical protein